MNAITSIPAAGSTAIAPVSDRMRAYLESTTGGNSEFAAGVTGGFPVLSIKGKIFAVRHKGVTTPIMRSPTEPAQTINVVIVKANGSISKTWYEGGFVDGSYTAPDCWSNNSVTPDPQSPKKQALTCAACPRNAWGSKINEATGKQSKECADNRRIALVPAMEQYAAGADQVLMNEPGGGPMLLRIPATSLTELVAYDAKLRAMGLPVFGVVTAIRFDHLTTHQKLVFTPVRQLAPDEENAVWALRDDARVEQILSIEQGEAPSDAPAQPVAPPMDAEAIQKAALAQYQAAQQAAVPVAPVAPVQVAAQPPAPTGFVGGFGMAPMTATVPTAANPPPVAQPMVQPTPATDPAFLAFQAAQAQQAEQARLAAEQAAEAERVRQHEAQEAANFAAWQAQQAAASQPAAPAIPPCPPGVDPAQWAAFQAAQIGANAPANTLVAPATVQPEPQARQRRRTPAPPTIPAQGAVPAAQVAQPTGQAPVTLHTGAVPMATPAPAQPVAQPSAPETTTATPAIDALLAGLQIG